MYHRMAAAPTMGPDGNSTPGPSEWCVVDPNCPNSLYPPSPTSDSNLMTDASQSSNFSSNASCSLPVCVQMLSFALLQTNVRVYDMVLMVLSAMFLFFLLVQLVTMIRKLRGSVTLFRILYFMVFVIPTFSCLYGIVSMTVGYYNIAAKALHTILRGSILMTELFVVVFGLFFKFYNNKQFKLALTISIIMVVVGLFTIVEGVMEFYKPLSIPCKEFGFFTHGGMVFLFTTSILFAFAYLITYVLYLLTFHQRWNLPSKKSFYRYALFLSIVNLVQAVGSLMWVLGQMHESVGNAGICITMLTNGIYITSFPPVVYWIFLSNYFRMNEALKQASTKSKSGHINVSAKDRSYGTSSWSKSISKPLGIGKKSSFFQNSSYYGESYGSTSSYGSLNDEETFIKRLTPPDLDNSRYGQ